MDLALVTRFFTLDVLSTVAFGKAFGFMAANDDLWDFNKTNADFLLILSLGLNHPWITWILARPWVQALVAPRDTDRTGFGPAVKFARKAVAERYGADAKVKNDMLGSFVNKGLSQLQCEAEAFLQILAGSESTTTGLRTTLFSLISNPQAYAKLKAEVDTMHSQKGIADQIIAYADAQKLPYLNACIWEALRMYPPLFGLQSKLAPAEGEMIDGVFFPPGTEVAICDEAMCRREDIFGPDCYRFDPDRWTEANEETRNKYRRTVDTIFGTGRYTCLGKHIAMIELHKAIFEVRRSKDM